MAQKKHSLALPKFSPKRLDRQIIAEREVVILMVDADIRKELLDQHQSSH